VLVVTTVAPLLGVMDLDPNAASWGEFWTLVQEWLQDAGGFAALGLALWTIYALLAPSPAIAGSRRKLISRFMVVLGVLALFTYLVALGLTVAARVEKKQFFDSQGVSAEDQKKIEKAEIERGRHRPMMPKEVWRDRALALAGLFALIALCEPFVLDFGRMRWRRIFALAKLSFKEALRKRVVWVFLLFLIVILFPAAWFSRKDAKPEDALKAAINVMSFWMTLVLIFTALLLAGFSIPTDVKNQTIHTVVSKPVERFEIVAGRFLGYLALVTIALAIQTGVALLFIWSSNVGPQAREESMKARVPIYGKFEFRKERMLNGRLETKTADPINVGREYDYRKHIPGGKGSYHRAVWSFMEPSELRPLADLPAVPLEFAFDVYRTTKGEENRGVEVTLDMITWKWDPSREDEFNRELSAANGLTDEQAKAERINSIAERFGRYRRSNFPVYDYHTYSISIPGGLIKNALSGTPDQNSRLDSKYSTPTASPYLQIKVKCESPSQMIGVADLDLYFLESKGRFWVNYFKAAIGLWCRLAIVIGLAVAISTYMAGVVSFLIALFLFLAGYFQEFLITLAADTNVGGGPLESLNRLVKGQTPAGEADKQTPSVQVALFGDDIFRWVLRRFMNILPDAERFTWSNYLAQGFSIRPDFIVLNLLFLVGYLLPWAILAYYLMRSREIAA
jgi:ABC-type transport system involved in multi-copper enzyme maturation permease subunit